MIDRPEMIWCQTHLEPFRKRWPKGYVPASMCLVHQALQDEEIQAATEGKVEAITPVLQEYGPLCCRYKPILRDLYEFPTATKKRYRILLKKHCFPPPGGWPDERSDDGPA